MAGILAIQKRWRLLIQSTRAGEIAPNFHLAAGDHRISQTKVGEGTRLPVDQGTLGHDGNRIAVRFAYEWHDDSGH
jgi:hypothetical protein